MTALVDLQGVDVRYGGVRAVRDVHMHVDAGEVVALLGPNGAGKSSLVRAIAGCTTLTGRNNVLGQPVQASPRAMARRGVCLVPDSKGIFAGLTVRENLLVASPSRRSDIRPALDWFPALEALLDRRAGLLSGGEQQMLALARAVLRRPRLLLIDELSLGLAPVVVRRLLPVLRRIADADGAAVVLVEQHVELALRYSDRGYVLVHGDLALSGPAAELLADEQRLHDTYLGWRTPSEESSA